MTKLTKKAKTLEGKVDSLKLYPVADALSLVKQYATAKFDESIDVAVQLGIDAKKSDQVVRGAVVLPNGTGKTKRVAVFAQGAKAEEAKAAGADIVGMDDLAAEIKAGKMDFDVVIASPDTMRIVGTLGQVLGPRGLMPNPKVGTVTPDVAQAVRNAKAGQVQFRVDKAGIVHATIGRRSLRQRQAAGQPAGADRRAEQGQAGVEQGHLPAQGGAVFDDGRGRPRGRGDDRRRACAGLQLKELVGCSRATGCRPSKTAGGVKALLSKGRKSPKPAQMASPLSKKTARVFRDGKVAGCVEGAARRRRHVLSEEQTLSLNRNEKAAVVTDVAAQVARSQTLALAEYRGLTVEHMNKLRVDARAKGVYLHVLKNTLARRAVAGTPFECAAEAMSGPLIYGFSEDAVAAAKVIADFAKGNDKLIVKAGAYAGKALDANGVKALAAIPSKEVLLAQLLGLMQVAHFAPGARGGGLAEKKGGGAEAAPAAAAADAAAAAPERSTSSNLSTEFRGNPNGIRQRRFPDRAGQHVRDGTQ